MLIKLLLLLIQVTCGSEYEKTVDDIVLLLMKIPDGHVYAPESTGTIMPHVDVPRGTFECVCAFEFMAEKYHGHVPIRNGEEAFISYNGKLYTDSEFREKIDPRNCKIIESDNLS